MDGINWEGGQIEVTKEGSGWDVQHRTVDGKTYSVDWNRFKSDAVRAARVIAKQRNAKIMVESN